VVQVLSWRGYLAQGLLGLGVGFIGPPLTAVTLQAVPRDQAGGASGVVNAARQYAAVGAIAMVSALLAVGGRTFAPATLLVAMPGLAALIALSLWMAWTLPPLELAPAPAAAH
jgi:hypothetical protein